MLHILFLKHFIRRILFFIIRTKSQFIHKYLKGIFCFTIQYLANVACCLSITLFTFRDEGRMFLRRINDLHVLSQICIAIVKFLSQIKRKNICTSLSRNGDHIGRGKYDIRQQPISSLPCPYPINWISTSVKPASWPACLCGIQVP